LETEKSLGILKKIPAVVFKDDQDVLAVAKTKPDERGAQVQTVGDDKVEGPGIVPNEAAQKPEGAAHLVFPFPLELDVQKKRNPAADEQSGHESMIKLQTPVGGLTLRAAGAASEERGGGFVPVEDENRPVQSFIAFQPLIETSQQTPQESVVHKGEDPADGIGTGKGTLKTAAPEGIALVLLQGMEAAQAGQDHEKGRGKDGPRRNDGPATRIGQGRKKALNPVATFGIGQKATENRLPLLFSLFQAVPIRGGNVLQKLQNLPVTANPEPDGLLLILGDIELLDLAVGAAGQDQGEMLLAALAVTTRLAADLLAEGRGGAEKLLPGDEGFELGAAETFKRSHSRWTHRGPPYCYL